MKQALSVFALLVLLAVLAIILAFTNDVTDPLTQGTSSSYSAERVLIVDQVKVYELADGDGRSYLMLVSPNGVELERITAP